VSECRMWQAVVYNVMKLPDSRKREKILEYLKIC
jgi:hypothetical protein